MKKYGIMIGAAMLLLGSACQREGNFPEVTNMPVEKNGDNTVAGKLLGQMIFDSVTYAIPPEKLLQPFIEEFGDGTVIDHAQIRKVQATKNDEPYYYAVGIGQKNGEFRMMALELHVAEDNSLYISPDSRKYVTTSRECDFCVFTYDHNVITGAECQNEASLDACTFAKAESNSFMRRK